MQKLLSVSWISFSVSICFSPAVGKHDDFIKLKLLYLQTTQTVYKIFLLEVVMQKTW